MRIQITGLQLNTNKNDSSFKPWGKWNALADKAIFGAAERFYAELSDNNREMLVNRAVVLYDGKAIREEPHDDDILVCDSCGSRQIEIQAWVDANNVEYLSDVDDDDTDCKWCAECNENQNFCTLSEYKQRMEKGLSFLEFNYMLMQSYDFYELFQRYGCNMQFGGDDQWSNMLGGTELIRRKLGKDAHAMTITLLLNSEGKKMGKTQSGAVWLDPEKTSPFDFYQYWRNVGDADVLKCLRMLTFLPLEQIDEMDKWEGSQLNKAKEILAFELTKLVHGEEEATKAQEGARALFAGGANTDNMPTCELSEEDFADDNIDILTVLTKSGLAASRSEARRNVEQGGVSVDGTQIKDIKAVFAKDQFAGDGVVVKRGKKNFKKVILK